MRERILLMFLLCLLCQPVSANGEASAPQDWISFNQFVEACMQREAAQPHLLQVLRNPDPEEVEFAIRFSESRCDALNCLPVYEAAWGNREKAYPALDFDYLAQPIIRLAIAGTLADLRGDPGGVLREYVLGEIQRADPRTLPYAILALGGAGTAADAERLIEIAKSYDREYLFQATAALIEMNTPEAEQALDSLVLHFGGNSEGGRLISEVRSRWADQKDK